MSTVRIPNLLLTRAKKAAEEKGMSFNDLLVHALDRELGGNGDPTIGFLDDVRACVASIPFQRKLSRGRNAEHVSAYT
jgi:hypothetical protein